MGRTYYCCKGRIDERNKKIIFADEDLEEEFYEKWNYDDEQSLATHQKQWVIQKKNKKIWRSFVYNMVIKYNKKSIYNFNIFIV